MMQAMMQATSGNKTGPRMYRTSSLARQGGIFEAPAFRLPLPPKCNTWIESTTVFFFAERGAEVLRAGHQPE